MRFDLFSSKNKHDNAALNISHAAKTKQLEEAEDLINRLVSQEKTLLNIKSAMEGSSAAIMMVDRDFVVTYVNQSSMQLFTENAAEFKAVFPTFDASKIIGTCIDVFHKHPAHQRQMLADTSKLPFQTDIRVGSLIIALYVTATHDQQGNYIGNTLEWHNVTADRMRQVEDYDSRVQKEAMDRFQGSIELGLDGNVLAANDTYLHILGYTRPELVGKHVSIVLEPKFANSPEYTSMWNRIVSGEYVSGQYKRIAKGGREVWIQSYYSPIKDKNNKIIKIVNYVIDITEQKLRNADFESQIAAINNNQAVIQFTPDGMITAMNQNFLSAVGYSESELIGKNHSMLVGPDDRSSAEYRSFWKKLAQGEFNAGQFKRITKSGKEVYLSASYNPILDPDGKVTKVVKFAMDVTQAVVTQQALAKAVEETQQVIQFAKDHDLSHRISLEDKTGSIVQLCDGINSLMDTMAEVVGMVKESSEAINTAANEISQGNNDLSQRTEEQASSLEETAASMEQLASTVKNNTENAKQAKTMASNATEVASKGGQIVGQVVTTMAEINQSSVKIVDIISVIDGIAFQTNILALNAAVEAARAGEQGRGFAVVASEVRNLAQRSASAAKEIKELINDSVEKTGAGTTLVENAGKTMQEVVTSVKRVSDIIGEIAAASIEQSTGIDQVNSAVTQMDEVTQQNAALVEQAAAASESLVEQASNLMDSVIRFKLASGQSSHQLSRPNKTMQKAPVLRQIDAPKAIASNVGKSKKVIDERSNDPEWKEF